MPRYLLQNRAHTSKRIIKFQSRIRRKHDDQKRENLKILRLLHLLFALSLSLLSFFSLLSSILFMLVVVSISHFINLCVGVNMRVNLMHCKTYTHEHIFFKVVDEEIFQFPLVLERIV